MPTSSIKTKSTVVSKPTLQSKDRTSSPPTSSTKSSSIGRPPTVVAPVSRVRSHAMKQTMEPSSTGMSTVEIIEKATASLSALSSRDALTVWKAFGLYLDDQMKRHRVLKVDGFGVFGYNDTREGIFLHNPAFLQSNRLKEAPLKGLKGHPALAVAAEPMSMINAAEIGQEYLQNCGRETVSRVISHVIALIGKIAKQGGTPLHLSFHPVGEWVCVDGDSQVEFRFQSKFQDEMKKKPILETPNKSCKKPKDGKERLCDEFGDGGEVGCRSQSSKKSISSKASTYMSQSDNASISETVRSSRTAWSDNPQKPKSLSASTSIIARVRSKIIERCGENGLNALRRVLSLMDTFGDGALSPQELKFGLRDLGIELTSSELTQVVQYFDRNGDGIVSLDELLTQMRGGRRSKSLSSRRLALINKAYALMDPRHKGVITLDDLRENYDVSLFPRVRAGKTTKVQAMTEFLREWEVETDCENNRAVGGITHDAFIDYYHNLSACIPDDSDFEMMMRQSWHVSIDTSEEKTDESEGEEETQALDVKKIKQTKVEDVKTDKDKQWNYLRTQLLVQAHGKSHTKPTLDDMSRRLGANRVWGDGNETMNSRAFANALCNLDRQLSFKDAQQLAQLVVTACSGGNDIIALAPLYQYLDTPPTKVSSLKTSSTSVSAIITRIRQRLLQRLNAEQVDRQGDQSSNVATCFLGLNALQRSLRLMDTNHDQRVSKDELKLGLKKFGVDINFYELDQLFTALDADRSGCIDAQEFLVAMRGEMNSHRLLFVHQAFDQLDRDGDGYVTLDELQRAYDTSKHPDVIAGRLSTREAIRLFAQQWDTIDHDDVITRQEFETYYKNISASIDSDDYFELMMRNAWHLSGGKGQSANTSNRRVLMVGKDGSQRVVEVQNDLGISAKDQDTIRAKLQATYGEVGEIQLTGSVENKSKKKVSRPMTSSSKHSNSSSRSKSSVIQTPSTFESYEAITKKQRLKERDLRERAALCIQANFRGFKSRKFADCVRRRIAAEHARKQREDDEMEARNRKRILRAPLKANYGF